MGDNQAFKSLKQKLIPFLYFLPDFDCVAGLKYPTRLQRYARPKRSVPASGRSIAGRLFLCSTFISINDNLAQIYFFRKPTKTPDKSSGKSASSFSLAPKKRTQKISVQKVAFKTVWTSHSLSAIQRVADNRMAKGFKVNPYLMSPACFWINLNKGVR